MPLDQDSLNVDGAMNELYKQILKENVKVSIHEFKLNRVGINCKHIILDLLVKQKQHPSVEAVLKGGKY